MDSNRKIENWTQGMNFWDIQVAKFYHRHLLFSGPIKSRDGEFICAIDISGSGRLNRFTEVLDLAKFHLEAK